MIARLRMNTLSLFESCFGKKAAIIMLEISNKYQRRGLGSELLKRVCDDIVDNGGDCLYTDTYLPNKSAIKFYIENDFMPVAVHECVNGIEDSGQIYLYRKLR